MQIQKLLNFYDFGYLSGIVSHLTIESFELTFVYFISYYIETIDKDVSESPNVIDSLMHYILFLSFMIIYIYIYYV